MAELGLFSHALTRTPIGTALDLCMALCVIFWFLSVITREYSWGGPGLLDMSAALLLALCFRVGYSLFTRVSHDDTRWSLEYATYNLARKGGYRAGGEDYR